MKKNYEIAVVDDESIQLNTMIAMIKEAAKLLDIVVHISSFQSGEEFFFHLGDLKALDIVFLDIEMEYLNGLEVAKKIREVDQEMTIVFATAFAEYAIEGYEVQALDYLLKPIKIDKIKQVLLRHINQEPEVKESITLDVYGERVKILVDDIIFIEVIKRECLIHLTNQKLTIIKPLKDLAKELPDTFIQPHRSYLVHVGHIERLQKSEIELSNGTTIPMSRRSANQVQKKFIDYHRGTFFYDD